MNGAQFDKLRGRVEEAIQRHGLGAVGTVPGHPEMKMKAGKMTGTRSIFKEAYFCDHCPTYKVTNLDGNILSLK